MIETSFNMLFNNHLAPVKLCFILYAMKYFKQTSCTCFKQLSGTCFKHPSVTCLNTPLTPSK